MTTKWNIVIGRLIVLVMLASILGCSPVNKRIRNVTETVKTTENKSIDRKINSTDEAPSTTSSNQDIENAREVLVKFFTLLSEKKYGEAIKYYGGRYDALRHWDPTVDKNDYVTLIEHGCEESGLCCYPVRRILQEKQLSKDMFEFTVEFTSPDGELFVQGPFPGEPNKVGTSRFSYTVKKIEDRFFVQELPPYVP